MAFLAGLRSGNWPTGPADELPKAVVASVDHVDVLRMEHRSFGRRPSSAHGLAAKGASQGWLLVANGLLVTGSDALVTRCY